MASAALPLPTSTSPPGRTPGLVLSSSIGASARAVAVARAWNSILGDEAQEDEAEEQQRQQQEGASDSKGNHTQNRIDDGTGERPRAQELRGLEEAEALSTHFSPGRAAQIWEKLHTWRAVEFGAPGSLFHRCCLLDWQGRVVSPWHHVPLHACDAAFHFVCTTPQDSWAQLEAAPDEEFNPLRVVRRPKTSSIPGPTSTSTAAAGRPNAGEQSHRVHTRSRHSGSHGVIPASLPELETLSKSSYTEGFSFGARGASLGHVRAQSLTTQCSSALDARPGAGPDASSSGARAVEGGGWDEEHEEEVVRRRKAHTWKELHTMEPGHYAENSIFNIGFLPQTWADRSSLLLSMSHAGSSSSRESTPRGISVSGRSSARSTLSSGTGHASGGHAAASMPSTLASASVAASSSPSSASAFLGSESEVTGAGGLGRPVEAIEIGMRQARRGEVYSTKPLAAFAVEEEPGCVAWKVVVIATDDALAPQLHGLADLERLYPAVLEQIQEWICFSRFNATALDEEATVLYDGQAQDVVTSLVVVAEAHSAWQLQFYDTELPSSPWQLEGVPGVGQPGDPGEPQDMLRGAEGQLSGGLARVARVLEREWERRGHILPLARASDEPLAAPEQPEVCPAEDAQRVSCLTQGPPAEETCELNWSRDPSAHAPSLVDRKTEASGQGSAAGCGLREGLGSPTLQAKAQPGVPSARQEAPQEAGDQTLQGLSEEVPSSDRSLEVTLEDILLCISLSDRRVFSGRSYERERARMDHGAGVSRSSSSSSYGLSRSSGTSQSTGSRSNQSTTSRSSQSTVGDGSSRSGKRDRGRGRSRSDWSLPISGALGEGGRQSEREDQGGLALTSTGRALSWTGAAAVGGGRGSEREEGSQGQETKWEALLPQQLRGLGMLRGTQKGPPHAHRGPVPEALALWEGDEESEGAGGLESMPQASQATSGPQREGHTQQQQQQGLREEEGVVGEAEGALGLEAKAGIAGSLGAAEPSAPRRRSVRGLSLLGRRDAGGSRGSSDKRQSSETRRGRSRSWTGDLVASSPAGSKAASPAAGMAGAEGSEAEQRRGGGRARKSTRGVERRLRWSAGNWHELSQAPGLFLGSSTRERKPKGPLRAGPKTAPKAGDLGSTNEQLSRGKSRNKTPPPPAPLPASAAPGCAAELPGSHSLKGTSRAASQTSQAGPSLPAAPLATAPSSSLPAGRGSGGGWGGASQEPSVAGEEKGVPFKRSSSLQGRPSRSVPRDAGRRTFSPPRGGRAPGGAPKQACPAPLLGPGSSQSRSFGSSDGSSKERSNSSSKERSSSSKGRDRSKAYVRSSSLPSCRGGSGPTSASAGKQHNSVGSQETGETGGAAGQRLGTVRQRLVVSSVQLSGCGVVDQAPSEEEQQKQAQQSLVVPGSYHDSGTGTGTGTGADESAANEGDSAEVHVSYRRGLGGPSSSDGSCTASQATIGLDSGVPEGAQAAPQAVSLERSGSDDARGQDKADLKASSFARKRQVSFHNIVEVVQFIDETGVPQASVNS